MRCDEFENRLNDLLDARSAPQQDAPLAAHAEECGSCRALLASQLVLLDRFQVDRRPAVAVDFTQQVLAKTASARPRRHYVLAALAASLLVAVGIRWMTGEWPLTPGTSQLGGGPIERPAPLDAPEINYVTAAREARRTFSDALSLLPTTDDLLAADEPLDQAPSFWSSDVADCIEPLTDSTGEAFDFLLSVLPGEGSATPLPSEPTTLKDGA